MITGLYDLYISNFDDLQSWSRFGRSYRRLQIFQLFRTKHNKVSDLGLEIFPLINLVLYLKNVKICKEFKGWKHMQSYGRL
jgi:hypothetical protein